MTTQNNNTTEGADSEEATTVKTETCKKCNGNGEYIVYDEMGLPWYVECCPLWDDHDDDQHWCSEIGLMVSWCPCCM